MKCLKLSLRENAIVEAKDLGVKQDTYEKMWFAVYAFVAQICKPTPKLIKEIIRVCGDIAKNADICSLHEEQEYAKQMRELRYLVDGSGVNSTDIQVVTREAKEPLSPANSFHQRSIYKSVAS